jgi:hypothetical protein
MNFHHHILNKVRPPMNRFCLLIAASLALPLFAGCDSGKIQPKTIDIPMQKSALEEAQAVLKHYVDGQPIGSEAASFDDLVKRVKAENAAMGETLEKGFAELLKTPAKGQKAKATELYKKLGGK